MLKILEQWKKQRLQIFKEIEDNSSIEQKKSILLENDNISLQNIKGIFENFSIYK